MTLCIIQARMGSTRLPGKSMKPLAGKPSLWHVVTRCQQAKTLDRIMVATTVRQEDDRIAAFCEANGVAYFRGSADNVLERYYLAARSVAPEVVVRVTADCPLIDPETIDVCVRQLESVGWGYLSNAAPGERTYPYGLDIEAFLFEELKRAYTNATQPTQKEHVTPYIHQTSSCVGPILIAPPALSRPYRLTVDYPEDFQLMERIYAALYQPGTIISTVAALAWLDEHPEVANINDAMKERWQQNKNW